jgi:hypothetical protein
MTTSYVGPPGQKKERYATKKPEAHCRLMQLVPVQPVHAAVRDKRAACAIRDAEEAISILTTTVQVDLVITDLYMRAPATDLK